MAKQSTILVVDDERTIREVVRRYLELDGFQVIEADNGTKALEFLKRQAPDLIILDIMLPEIDGLHLLRKIRNPNDLNASLSRDDIPVILLTARGEELERISGFEMGADDYITKPFSPRELVVRVKAVLRRSSATPSGEAPVEFGALHLDPRRRSVTIHRAPVTLTAKEFDLLWFLVRHPHQVFSRAQLLDHVWGYEFFGDESTVTVHVRRLREKIEPDPAKPSYIHTVWGVGYKFESPDSPTG